MFTKDGLEKILSQQITDLSQYIKENSSKVNAIEYGKLHFQLENCINTYFRMFLDED